MASIKDFVAEPVMSYWTLIEDLKAYHAWLDSILRYGRYSFSGSKRKYPLMLAVFRTQICI